MPTGCDVEKGIKWIKARLATTTARATRTTSLTAAAYTLWWDRRASANHHHSQAGSALRSELRADGAAFDRQLRIGGHEQLRIYGRLLG